MRKLTFFYGAARGPGYKLRYEVRADFNGMDNYFSPGRQLLCSVYVVELYDE